MASSKRLFAGRLFAGRLFAPALFRGVGTGVIPSAAGELFFTAYVTPSIRSLAALSTSVNAGAQMKPSIEGRVT